MGLLPGTHLGSYEILDAIGAGGMGEVYRARDTKLNRDVAVKTLPDAFVLDVERLARFKREAQVLASLNHPNIAAIYGLEESDGTRALILEFVDGLTLAERIAQGAASRRGGSVDPPLPIDEALAIARQIAEALEAAHEMGIIHRDLKPANIKVRPDGTVKVLDFGLAKAGQPGPGIRDSGSGDDFRSQFPTITTPAMTQVGVILGTAAYMSPEQAKGRPADKRGDIWAYGCVLYEMLTAKRAFDGEDITDTIAAVVRATPDWSQLPPETPQRIRDLIRRCLAKDRKERLPHIGAARLEVKEALANPHAESSSEPATSVSPTRERRMKRRTALSVVAAVLVTAIVTGAVAWFLRSPAASQPLMRFNIVLAQQEGFSGLSRQMVAISPDGTQIVYTADNRLYQRPIDELTPQSIAATETDGTVMGPVFSPDGQWIAYHGSSASDNAIRRVPLNGGPSTTVVQTANPGGMTWDERGIVYSRGREGVFLVSPNGGTPEQLVRLSDGEAALRPQLLPGGDAVLFTLVNAPRGVPFTQWGDPKIVVQSLTSGERSTLIENGSDGRYLPSGHLVFAVSGSMFAVIFDAATRRTSGDRVPILTGVRRGSRVGAAQFSVSNTGSLVYIPGPVDAVTVQRVLSISDRSGKTHPLKLPPANYSHPRVSPDGTRVAVAVEDENDADISIYELAETSAVRRLTIEGQNRYPVWSHDGQRVAFQSARQGSRGVMWQRADGQSSAEPLTTAAEGVDHVPESMSPDGQFLLFTELKDQTYTLFVLSMADKSIKPFGNVTSPQPIGATFSRDGRWVVYASTPRGVGLYSPDRGVFIQPFPATGVPIPVPKQRIDYHPAWAPNGQSLFYVSAAGRPLVAMDVRTQPTIAFGPAMELPLSLPRPGLQDGNPRGYDILPDGRVLTVSPAAAAEEHSSGAEDRPEIRVVINWLEELKRLVPASQ